MKWEVGKLYTIRSGKTVRCLATDVPTSPLASQPYPILCMDVQSGALHQYTEEGRIFPNATSPYDVVPRVRKVAGWVCEVCIQKNYDSLAYATSQKVFVTGEITEE